MTAEFIAKKIGKTTVETSAISESAGTQKRSITTPRSESIQKVVTQALKPAETF
jgi:hypothetical protein